MDIEMMSNLIANIGFPMAICLILFAMVFIELRAMRETINNNTLAIQVLSDKIGGEK